MTGRGYPLLVAGLGGLVAALFLASLLIGPLGIGPSFAALTGRGDAMLGLVLREIRLPRAALGLMVGAALGLSGAVMQGYLRNPLADPGLLGVSPGAAFGAVVSLYFGYAAQAWLLPIFALAGAATAMALLALIAGRSASLVLFTLAGLVITNIAGSLTALAISLAPTPFVASEIITWLNGALTDRSWDDVKLALPLALAGAAILAVEHAPPRRRGFFGSFTQLGSPAGMLLATGSFFLVRTVAGNEAFLDWAWRLPFLASVLLVIVGLVIRLRIEDAPEFVALREQGALARLPVVEVLRAAPRNVVITLGLRLMPLLGLLYLIA